MAPLKELDDSTKGLDVWHRPVLLCRCLIPITDIKGLYLYPCPNTTPGRLRVQHLISKLMLQCQNLPSSNLQWRTKSSYLGKSHPLKVHSVLLSRSPP
jgi:hypothetical protein